MGCGCFSSGSGKRRKPLTAKQKKLSREKRLRLLKAKIKRKGGLM